MLPFNLIQTRHRYYIAHALSPEVPKITSRLYLFLLFTVITLREHQDDTGVAIVCFMESPEEYQIEEIEQLLQKLEITEKSTSRLNSLLDSNLYI